MASPDEHPVRTIRTLCLRTLLASPSRWSARSALAATSGPQPNSSANSVSEGSLAPAGYSPSLIRRASTE